MTLFCLLFFLVFLAAHILSAYFPRHRLVNDRVEFSWSRIAIGKEVEISYTSTGTQLPKTETYDIRQPIDFGHVRGDIAINVKGDS